MVVKSLRKATYPHSCAPSDPKRPSRGLRQALCVKPVSVAAAEAVQRGCVSDVENQKRLKRAEDIHFAEVGDEFYLTLENRQVVACINPSAFVLLENLNGFADPDDVANALAERYGAPAEEVRQAVAAVCDEAERLGIIEAVGGESGSNQGPFAVEGIDADRWDLPKILRVWAGDEIEGGMFVNSAAIGVIVPNVTQGPIKTCPTHTCTIPAGLFTPDTIIRTFDSEWRQNFERFRRSGIVHFSKRNPRKGER
jgi:hypothetical protein